MLLCGTHNSSSDKPNACINNIPEDQNNAVSTQHCIQKTTFFSFLNSNEQTYYRYSYNDINSNEDCERVEPRKWKTKMTKLKSPCKEKK